MPGRPSKISGRSASGTGDSRWSALRTLLLAQFVPHAAPIGTAVVVPVPGGATYEQAVPYHPLGGSLWLSRLPTQP